MADMYINDRYHNFILYHFLLLTTVYLVMCLRCHKVCQNTGYADRWRQLEMRTSWWVDCRNLTLDATLLRSAVWYVLRNEVS